MKLPVSAHSASDATQASGAPDDASHQAEALDQRRGGQGAGEIADGVDRVHEAGGGIRPIERVAHVGQHQRIGKAADAEPDSRCKRENQDQPRGMRVGLGMIRGSHEWLRQARHCGRLVRRLPSARLQGCVAARAIVLQPISTSTTPITVSTVPATMRSVIATCRQEQRAQDHGHQRIDRNQWRDQRDRSVAHGGKQRQRAQPVADAGDGEPEAARRGRLRDKAAGADALHRQHDQRRHDVADRQAQSGLGHTSRPSLTIGGTTPRIKRACQRQQQRKASPVAEIARPGDADDDGAGNRDDEADRLMRPAAARAAAQPQARPKTAARDCRASR